jgi:hypothetical protein
MQYSLRREYASVVYNYCWPSPAYSYTGPSPAELMTKFYSLRFDIPTIWRAMSSYLYPQEQVGPVMPPGTGFSFRRLFDSQGYGGDIRTRLQGDLLLWFWVWILCYDRRSVGQSVSGLWPDFYYCQTIAGLLMWGALSDERTGVSFTIVTGPGQISHSRVRVPWDSRPYFTLSDSRLPFRRLLRFAGLWRRYSTTPPHWTTYTVARRTHSKHIRCLAMDICEPHRKHRFPYCCIYSTLHKNGGCPIVACVFVVAYCFRFYLATDCLPRICLRGNVYTELLSSNGSTCHSIQSGIYELKCNECPV